jgi:hypothetical protein
VVKLNFFYIWLGSMLLVCISASLFRRYRNKKPAQPQEFLTAGFALGSAVALAKVFVRLLYDQKLQADLDFDANIALSISCFLGMYISLKEVGRLY